MADNNQDQVIDIVYFSDVLGEARDMFGAFVKATQETEAFGVCCINIGVAQQEA